MYEYTLQKSLGPPSEISVSRLQEAIQMKQVETDLKQRSTMMFLYVRPCLSSGLSSGCHCGPTHGSKTTASLGRVCATNVIVAMSGQSAELGFRFGGTLKVYI